MELADWSIARGTAFSGLTVDRYCDWLSVQFTGLGLAERRERIADLLAELVPCAGIYLRTEKGIGQLEGLSLSDGPLRGGTPPPLTIVETGMRFMVNLAEGQKTGYYLDQRDNRLAAARLLVGRRVLDAFCYSGGFGLRARQHGAVEVIGIDGSEAALSLARENASAQPPRRIELM
jgi:23S rRNA (cytosine1962-C5)-methyltransferase